MRFWRDQIPADRRLSWKENKTAAGRKLKREGKRDVVITLLIS